MKQVLPGAKKVACPIAKAASIVGDTYVILIVRDLLLGPKHFSELARSVEGVSTRTLSIKLRRLEDEGLLKRAKLHKTDVHLAYSLTKKGKALSGVTEALRRVGATYR